MVLGRREHGENMVVSAKKVVVLDALVRLVLTDELVNLHPVRPGVPHHFTPAERCSFLQPPALPFFWDQRCKLNNKKPGCWADGVHAQCRFCGEEPYTGIPCPANAIVPRAMTVCKFDNPPVTPFFWDSSCFMGMKGCLADGKHIGCRFCGAGNYSDIQCPASVCSFANEPWTPYYWDDFCQWGMLGCNADSLHIQCRFCDKVPFQSISCPEKARPAYPDGKCWFPVRAPQGQSGTLAYRHLTRCDNFENAPGRSGSGPVKWLGKICRLQQDVGQLVLQCSVADEDRPLLPGDTSEGSGSERAAGIGSALAVGVFGGSVLVPFKFIPPESAGLTAIPSFGIGALVAGVLVTLAYWKGIKQEKDWPTVATDQVLAGLASGLIWNAGNVCSVIAQSPPFSLPYGVAYPILQCALFFGGLWGIYAFKEIVGSAVAVFWSGAVTLAVGIVLLSLYGPSGSA
ncbi:unnamed protein product [Symbiodinium necroappetens]|uniref:Uncharacterized protein n=1 Tax=Symbiodinium necroappetens TaxID=1628268 RepID=A0A812WLC3_9DINO|nr:unnamed protein product [Symbiodinium necroappetens]